MHRFTTHLTTFVLSATLIAPSALDAVACTTIIVGKKATANGSIIIARNSDSSKAVNAKHLMVHGSHFNTPGSVFRCNSNDFTYPLPERSPKYLGLPY